MTDRQVPVERGVRAGVPGSGGLATPSVELPDDADDGLPGAPSPTVIGSQTFEWGTRTFVMGIVNVTPDSFSGDGVLARTAAGPGPHDHVAAAIELGSRMAREGADIFDVGGESSRPGHVVVSASEEIARVVPVIGALRRSIPDVPISIDTVKPATAEAALDAGASLINDVWGVAEDDALARLAAERGVPIVLMHNRAEARYDNLIAEVIADLQRSIERAVSAGCRVEDVIVDPGFGFGKAPVHNLALLRDLSSLRILGRPVLLGTSRKSTLGRILDLPPEERLEATLATTALGIAAGVDIVRVHDVEPNVRVARMADAIVRRDQPVLEATGR